MIRTLKREQFLPITLDRAWEFFSDPRNLSRITPNNMNFRLLSGIPQQMYEGIFIQYLISPLPFTRVKWVTEIARVKEKVYFIDEQRVGPYKIWHHEHHFREVDGGVLITDLLHYDIGKSIFGWFAGVLFVHKRVAEIFNYRAKTLVDLFVDSEKSDEV